ncbi:MAG: right-handed parallel beta-helix repeat-containing protein [Calditrichaeota bacterium]|nr:right-handed parallel beta-helix repeat-containing protein [Calditrichota bacterium]
MTHTITPWGRLPLALLALGLSTSLALADWSSPGTGQSYTPDEIVALSTGTLSGSWPVYTQTGDLTISSTDTLSIAGGCQWQVSPTGGPWELRVHGMLLCEGSVLAPVQFLSTGGQAGDWSGLVLDEADSSSRLSFTTIRHADRGLSVLGCAPEFAFGTLAQCYSTGLHCFLGGNPVIRHTLIEQNFRYGAEITGGSSPVLQHCVFRQNNLEATSPRNAVSVGLQGSNNPRLEYCLLEGSGPTNAASGFSHWLAGDSRLSDCEIRDFRSGVVIQGSGAQGLLERCWIHDNRYSNPLQGGSGINVNSAATPAFRACVIQNNDWGVTLTSACTPDFGTGADPGANALHGNGNGGTVWDFFNNTSGAVQAVGNWWGTVDPATVEQHINDNNDGAYGEVSFLPLREDSLLVPLVSPGLGWALAPASGALMLHPASHFRMGSTLDITLSGDGDWIWQGDSLAWSPLPASPNPALLVLEARDASAQSALDSLWIFHVPQLIGDTPELTISRSGNDLLLGWHTIPGATSYRVYTVNPGSGWSETFLQETSETELLLVDALLAGNGAWRVRAVFPDEGDD